MTKLILALSLTLATATMSYAMDTANATTETKAAIVIPSDTDKAKQAAMNMRHANPVPNYMLIVRKEADTLKLTDEQKAKANEWFEKNNANTAELVKKIMAAEQAMAESSLQGASKDDILKQFDEVVAMRRTLVEGKTACRDYLKEVLTAEQWAQVVEMQKATLANHK